MQKFKSNKQQFDLKKSLTKLFDYKRDCFSRLRALKSICDAKDIKELKDTFMNNYSIIYSVFHETFVILDSVKYNGHHRKTTTDDDRLLFFIFEKILILLPEKLEKKWQMNSLIFIFRKCLQQTNLLSIRLEAMRLFLIYYQILGEQIVRQNQQIELLYASLIPGIVLNEQTIIISSSQHLTDPPLLIDQNQLNKYYGIRPFPIEPFILNIDNQSLQQGSNITTTTTAATNNSTNNYESKHYTKIYFTQHLLDYTISQCTKIYWRDNRERKHLRGFEFLFASFSRIYLPYIFPVLAIKNPNEMEWNNFTIRLLISIYHLPTINEQQLPRLRKFNNNNITSQNEHLPLLQAVVVQWFVKYLLGKDNVNNNNNNNGNNNQTSTNSNAADPNILSKYSNSQLNLFNNNSTSSLQSSQSSSSSTTTTLSIFNQLSSKSMSINNQQTLMMNNNQNQQQQFEYESELFRLLLNSKKFYVDLVLNIFHQSFLWPFNENLIMTMLNVLKVFRQWIYKEVTTPLPLFLAEPPLNQLSNNNNDDNVCAGYMNMMNIFIMLSSNVFLLEIPSDLVDSLEKQVEVSKRVFNIYRFMVMKIEMDKNVWENLVQALIRVTESIITPEVPAKREDNLGGRLAPALFQTLIVTWIKANLNIQITNELWEKFHQLVSSLTEWEELISEWSNTMFILNRVMSRHVFQINLNELPMDKTTITDRKRELRNKPRLHHIRSVSNTTTNHQHGGQQETNNQSITTKNNNQFNQQQQQQQQQQHEVISRTSSQTDSVHSTVQRFASNESTTESNKQQQQRRSHQHQKISTPLLHSLSINRHREYHKNQLINRLIKRSLSDSCLMLTIQQSLCPIRTSIQSKIFIGKSCSFFNRSSINRRNLSTKKNPHSIKNRLSQNYFYNLPMIDDEEIVNEEEMTIMMAMGIGESFDYQQQQDYYNDNDDGMNDCISINEYNMIDYLRRRTLYRSNSMNDLQIMYYTQRYNNIHRNHSQHNHHHHHRHHSNQTTTNGSDSVADTLSLGASYTTGAGVVGECNNSLKETPITFDSTSAASTCSSSITDQQMSLGSSESSATISNKFICDNNSSLSSTTRPVLLGGQCRGWNAEVAAILWRRMLEILGDPNDIKDPKLHCMAFECLAKIIEDFTKIRDNITYNLNVVNYSELNCGSSSLLLVPSLHYFTSWLFKATTLPQKYKSGRLLAYKLLCMIAMYRSEQELSKEFLILFYLALKRAILSEEMELVNTIIKYCGSKFFSAALWGSSCLLFHFVSAANIIINSTEMKYPRIESLQLLGSLIGFFDIFSNVICIRSTDTILPETYNKLKDHVIEIIILASKREQSGLGRVISFCSLTIFLYREFNKGTEFNRIKDIINILIAGTKISIKRAKPAAISPSRSHSPNIIADATNNNNNNSTSIINYSADNSKFNNRIICRVACDMLRLLADHSGYLQLKHPDLVKRIIEGLCYTFELHLDVLKQKTLLKDFKNLLLCIMFCLSHWCMSIDKDFLLNTLISEDYPGKICCQSQQQQQPCLLDLVISLFILMVNLDPVMIVKNQSLNSSTSEALKNSPQIGDMETMDYTIMSSNNNNNNDDVVFNSISNDNHNTTGSLSFDKQIEMVFTLKKAAHLILLHFMNFMGHFPQSKSSSLSALINENDDNPYVSQQNDKVDFESINAPNVLVFTINDTCLMSFVQLPLEAFDSSIWTKLSLSSNDSLNLMQAKPIRIIIRNVLGKFAWDSIMVTSPLIPIKNSINSRQSSSLTNDHQSTKSTSPDLIDAEEDEKVMNSYKNSLIKDNLEILVNSIYETTPECRPTNTMDDFLQSLNQMPEAVDTLALLFNQHFRESQFIEDIEFNNNRQHKSSNDNIISTDNINNNDSSNDLSSDLLDPVKAFQYCRQMIEQFGFLSWEKRKQIELLSKNQSTVREIRHLDNQQFRDQHKIAVIYVGHCQETRESILLNKCGSQAFEEFVSRLGWEVNLATHSGFMGGLQSNLSTGLTAPYYADSFNEVIFHVSTRLKPVNINNNNNNQHSSQSIDKQQLMNMKMRHLGNDEVHIIWSEHYKEYRRSILATEFGDVLIVIYPLPAHTYPNLFRIQIMRKAEVPFFGPLFHGAVVNRDELAGLVRATAINASRGKRFNMDDYKAYFETRYDTIKNLITKFKEPTIFEEYANRIFAPRYDLLQCEKHYATDDLTKLMDSGFITLDDFIQCTMQTNQSFTTTNTSSIPSTPHSITQSHEPISPASSTLSSEISFNQQHHQPASPQSPYIQSPGILMDSMMPFNKMVLPTPTSSTTTTSSSSGTSLRGLRPHSRSSFK